MKPIVTSLSPNAQPDDVQLARDLLSQLDMNDQQSVRQLQHQLEDVTGLHARPTSAGRSALVLGLQALGIKPGDEVITQAFTCLAVPAAIVAAGGTPVFVDIDPSTYNTTLDAVQRAHTPRTRAIIAQHTFGIAAPVQELRAFADTHNIALIEDLAHAFGVSHQGRQLGSWGDASIISFGRDKVLSSVFGGALLTPREDILASVDKRMEQLAPPPVGWVRQQLRHPLVLERVLPWYFRGPLGKAALVLAQRFGYLSLAVTPHERTGEDPPLYSWTMPPPLARLAQHQLTKLPAYVQHRQHIVDVYAGALPAAPSGPLLRYPLRVSNPAQVLRAAVDSQIQLGDWYRDPIAPQHEHAVVRQAYRAGSYPHAEHAARTTVNLPTHQGITDDDARRIIDTVRDYVI